MSDLIMAMRQDGEQHAISGHATHSVPTKLGRTNNKRLPQSDSASSKKSKGEVSQDAISHRELDMATPAETVDLKPDEEGAEDEASTLNELLKLIDEYDDRDALHSFFERLEQEEHDRVRGVAVPTLHAEFSKLICDPEASDKRISVILSIAARIHVEAEARRPERKQD